MSHLCEDCGMCFKRLCGLNRHARKHKAPPYYVCPEVDCNMEFNRKVEFERHLITHKPDYKPASVRTPLKLSYNDPNVVPYPELMKYYEVKKLINKHEPSTGAHFVDLLILIKTSDEELLPKIWDNVLKGITNTLPAEDTVRFIIHQRLDENQAPATLATVFTPIRDFSGKQLVNFITYNNDIRGQKI
ncbi:MAG: C2H2-type zinc finger protein [bacterium]|nr:C2H2-type zinc finger protein [bacterium]